MSKHDRILRLFSECLTIGQADIDYFTWQCVAALAREVFLRRAYIVMI